MDVVADPGECWFGWEDGWIGGNVAWISALAAPVDIAGGVYPPQLEVVRSYPSALEAARLTPVTEVEMYHPREPDSSTAVKIRVISIFVHHLCRFLAARVHVAV